MFLLFGRSRTAIYIRLALIAILIIVAIAFHLHGTTLLIIRGAVLLVVVLAFFAVRATRARRSPRDDA